MNIAKCEMNKYSKWVSEHIMRKVVLKATTLEIMRLYHAAEAKDILASLVFDAGLTQIAPGSMTALGLGPDEDELLDELTGHLKLL